MADRTHSVSGIPYRAVDNGDGTYSQMVAIDTPIPVTGSFSTSQVGAANIASGQVAASTAAATLVAARTTRRSVLVKNLDATIKVYIGPATVTAANGMELKAGESVSVDWTGLLQVIAASGAPTVAYMETFD